MAVPPRPSLRSSSRQSTHLPDDIATAGGSNTHSSTKHLGKRAHDNCLGNGDHHLSKKLKLSVTALNHPHVLPKVSATTSLSPGEESPGGPTTAAFFTTRTNPTIQLPANSVITTNNLTLAKEQLSVNSTVKGHKGTNGKVIKAVDKRTLRSHDGGSRSKSELSLYFHNYEELIGNEPKNTEILTADTQILIIDEAPRPTQSLDGSKPTTWLTDSGSHEADRYTGSLHPLANAATGSSTSSVAQKIDFSSIAQHVPYTATDPLSDDIYFKAHRRAERQEKQLRNIERERAQHEKIQLERLLEGLKGHDWLRIMGISGITDSEKKSFESKRDWFVREVSLLIDKFRRWKEEEKRRKVEKELSVKADEEEDDEDEGESGGSYENSAISPHDVDALAALQLQNESVSASRTKHKGRNAIVASVQPLPLERPFTSFYSKSYMREAALGKHRRGRTRFAFGQIVPEPAERPFDLPRAMLTDDAIRASARSRRRARRESKDT